jgi:hypothetical protein
MNKFNSKGQAELLSDERNYYRRDVGTPRLGADNREGENSTKTKLYFAENVFGIKWN